MVCHIRAKKTETQYTHLPSFTSPYQDISFSLPTSPVCLPLRWRRLNLLRNGQRGYPDEIRVGATVPFTDRPERQRVPADSLEAGGLQRHPGHGGRHGRQAVVLDREADDAPSLLGIGFRQPEARQFEVDHNRTLGIYRMGLGMRSLATQITATLSTTRRGLTDPLGARRMVICFT